MGDMKAILTGSGMIQRQGQGNRPWVEIDIQAETEEEKAILRLASVGTVHYNVWSTGNASVKFRLPRVKSE